MEKIWRMLQECVPEDISDLSTRSATLCKRAEEGWTMVPVQYALELLYISRDSEFFRRALSDACTELFPDEFGKEVRYYMQFFEGCGL